MLIFRVDGNACKAVIASLQVPYYLGELMEKISGGDRLQILKASQAMLKVNTIFFGEL